MNNVTFHARWLLFMRQNLQRNTRSYDIIPSHYLGIISFFFLSVHTITTYYSWLMASNKSIIFTNTIILVNMLTSASRTYEWMFAFVPLFVLLSRQILILQFHGRNEMFTSSYSNYEKYYDHLKRSNIGKKRLFFPLLHLDSIGQRICCLYTSVTWYANMC